jgi:hypothetical protein
MVYESEGVVPRKSDEPEGKLRQVHRDGIAVNAVQAAVSDEPPRVKQLVRVGRDRRHTVVCMPRVDEPVGELTARLNEERSRPHGRVAYLEIEDGFRGQVVT